MEGKQFSVSGYKQEHILVEFPNGEVQLATKQIHIIQQNTPKMSLLRCFRCKQVLQYPSGLQAVKCGACSTFNKTPSQIAAPGTAPTPLMRVYECPHCKANVQAPSHVTRMICGVCNRRFQIQLPRT